jgi:hypothetical protein
MLDLPPAPPTLKVTFTAALHQDSAPEQSRFHLLVDGLDPILMEKPSSSPYLPTITVSFVLSAPFPFVRTYTYLRDDEQCPDGELELRVHSNPIRDHIFVTDSIPSTSQLPSDRIHVSFNVVHELPPDHELAFESIFPPNYVTMDRLGPSNWTCVIPFPCNTFHAIIYRYHRIGPDSHVIESESGRPHVLLLNTSIGGSTVSIHDTWSTQLFVCPFYGRVIHPATATFLHPTFSVEFLSPLTGLFLRLGDGDPDPMANDGAWILEKTLEKPISVFSIGADAEWQDFTFPALPLPVSVSAVRLFGSEAARRTACVYAPLVSLKADQSDPIGDFAALVALARWARRAGIGQVHVHVERLPGQLLDPVHAVVDLAGDLDDFTVQSVRTAKLRILWAQYQSGFDQSGLESFLELFPYVTAKCGGDRFAQWVQFVLFRQLSAAFVQVADLGVQLLLDFAADGDLADQELPLRLTSYFAHGVRLVGFDRYVAPVSVPRIRAIFGTRADLIVERYCAVSADGIALKPEAFEAGPDLERLRELARMERAADPEGCLAFLERLPGLCPSALILDPTLSGFARLSGFVRAVTDGGECDRFSHVFPSYLSPEMISEFPQSVALDGVTAVMQNRAASEGMSVSFYLADLFTLAHGERARDPPDAIQSIKGHRRFMFTYALEARAADEAAGEIRAFLERHGRVA